MLPLRVIREKDRIDALQNLLRETVNDVDPRIQNIYANHLVLAASGFVESSLRAVLAEYSHRNGDPRIGRYIEKTVSRQNALNCEKIKSLLEHFDSSWWRQIEDRATPEGLSSVDSLKTLRDQIAHGKPNGTGFVTIGGYYQGVKRFVSDLSEVVVP